jgi:hypothetical protein
MLPVFNQNGLNVGVGAEGVRIQIGDHCLLINEGNESDCFYATRHSLFYTLNDAKHGMNFEPVFALRLSHFDHTKAEHITTIDVGYKNGVVTLNFKFETKPFRGGLYINHATLTLTLQQFEDFFNTLKSVVY